MRLGPRLTPQLNKVARTDRGVVFKDAGALPGQGFALKAPPSRNPLSPVPPRNTENPVSRKIPPFDLDGDVPGSDARPQAGSGSGGSGTSRTYKWDVQGGEGAWLTWRRLV